MAATLASKTASTTPASTWESRAVKRLVEVGSWISCVHCGESIKFAARVRHEQAICNIYENNAWQRVEHYHAECYVEAGAPYGEMTS